MKTTVVTGAASGIGAATVRRLLSLGRTVVAVDVAEAPDEFRTDAVRWIVGDIGSLDTWRRVTDATQTGFGEHAHGLVLCAARHVVGDILETDEAQWEGVFNTNVMGAYHGIRSCLPAMREHRDGAIVTVASVDAFMAEQRLTAYCASKGALIQMTRAVALDFARDGVRANCICPGVTDTPFFRRHLESAEDPESWLGERVARQPLGRLLSPEDVAGAIVFLLSDDAAAMVGSTMVVDAGLSAGFDFREA